MPRDRPSLPTGRLRDRQGMADPASWLPYRRPLLPHHPKWSPPPPCPAGNAHAAIGCGLQRPSTPSWDGRDLGLHPTSNAPRRAPACGAPHKWGYPGTRRGCVRRRCPRAGTPVIPGPSCRPHLANRSRCSPISPMPPPIPAQCAPDAPLTRTPGRHHRIWHVHVGRRQIAPTTRCPSGRQCSCRHMNFRCRA